MITQTALAAQEPTAQSGPSRGLAAAVLGASALTIMAAAIIAPSLPAMADAFSRTPGADVLVRLALTVTSLAIAVTAPFAGLLADRVGSRPLLLVSLALYSVAGVSGFFVRDLPLLLGSRALLGIAVGGIMTTVTTIITNGFQGPKRGSFLALQQASASLGGVIFLPLAGVLAGVSWRAPFLLYGAGLLVLPIALIALREPRRKMAAATAGAGSTDAEPGARWRLAGIYALALSATAVFFMAPTQLPFTLPGFGAPTAMTGVVVAGSTATGVIGALTFPRLQARLSRTLITGISVLLLGGGWVLTGTAASLAQIVAGALIGGIGVGLVVPNLNLRVSELATSTARGRLLGGLVASIFLGQFLSPLLAQPLIRMIGIPAAFTWSGIMLVAGSALAIAAMLIRRSAQHQ